MRPAFLHLHNLSFTHAGASAPVLQGLQGTLPAGWTGVVGANGAGKTTLLQLATGLLQPGEGVLEGAGGLLCPQRTGEPPEGLDELLEAQDREAWTWRTRLGIEPGAFGAWSRLSHGERKRAQLALALWRNPPLLAVDEPTNHLDAQASAQVRRALSAYRGIGLLVSHDRDLLDALCGQCLFLEGGHGVLRPGGHSAGAAQEALERQARLRERAQADRTLRRLEAEQKARREKAGARERSRSKRGLAPGDSDGRARIDALRVADGGSGAGVRQLEGRLEQAQARRALLEAPRDHAMGITLRARSAPRPLLLSHPGGFLPLGPARRLEIPPLVIRPGERIGLDGPNGAGKTTLLRALLAGSPLADEAFAHLVQEVDAAESRERLERLLAEPRETLGRLMALVRRLGSDPARILQSAEPSPGELRKLLIAQSLLREPCLMVLDEPTNHLDLPSIRCLEQALGAYPGALLLVSHDARFLRRLTTRRWEIRQGEGGPILVDGA